MYPEELVRPMRAELVKNGFTELRTAVDVDEALAKQEGSALLVVNSVCGCAAGSARPGVLASLRGDRKPERLLTVFAGQDAEATARARENLVPYPPSSPSIALFKDGKLVHMIERHFIEGRTPDMIAQNLAMAYEEFC